ncbi:MAG: hypothetical protein ACKVYV_16505 [Limisphaerales bacterium]
MVLGNFLFPCPASAAVTNDAPRVLLVVGAPGEAEYATNFLAQAARWEAACAAAGAAHLTLGTGATNTAADLDQLRLALEAEPRDGPAELWLVLIGHGTFDGKTARFNLRGPDLTVTNLAQWLAPFRRPLAVINTASASAPFLNALAGTNRVVITATRSGAEQNLTRFGQFFAEAVADPAADLDRDGQTSLLEAFLAASARVKEFYETENRLATEHALLDDNGDGRGTPADWFRGTRAVRQAAEDAAPDGARAHQRHLIRSPAEGEFTAEQRARRDELEQSVEALRRRKAGLAEEEYYRELERLLLDLARLHRNQGS